MNTASQPSSHRPSRFAQRLARRLSRGRALARGLVVLAATLGVVAAPGCGGGPSATPVAPVLVIGVDGLEWSVMSELLAAGELPHLRGLMERGAFGRLGTFRPALSPVVWTTIATGKLPGHDPGRTHGILHFADAAKNAYTVGARGTAALWNMADGYGLSSNVFGWWITWPVEPIDGVMVSGSSSMALVDQTWKPALALDQPGQVHPPELEAEVMQLAARVGSREELQRLLRQKILGSIPEGTLGEAERTLIDQSVWSVQSDATFTALAEALMPRHPADLNLVYISGPDVVGHRFWRHYRPDEYDWHGDPAADAALADVVPDYYRWTDELVGRLIAAAPRDATVIVVSDHGMTVLEAVRHEPPQPNPQTGEIRWATGHHLAGDPGVFIAAGPGIARHGDVDLVLRGSPPPAVGPVTQVTPTILALLGIPAGRDMGGVLRGVLDGQAAANADLPRIPSHDAHWNAPPAAAMPETMDHDFLERYRQIGYLEVEVPEGFELVNPADFEAGEDDG